MQCKIFDLNLKKKLRQNEATLIYSFQCVYYCISINSECANFHVPQMMNFINLSGSTRMR